MLIQFMQSCAQKSYKLLAQCVYKHLNADFGRVGSHGQLEKELITKLLNADIVLFVILTFAMLESRLHIQSTIRIV